MPIAESTVAAMLGAVREAARADDLPRAIVMGFERVLGADYTTYDEFAPEGARVYARPVAPASIATAFSRYGHEHPSLADYQRTRIPFTRRLSDVASQRALRRLGLWAHVFRPLGIRYQLNLPLHADGERVVGVGLSRTGHDFSDAEIAVAELLRVELARIVAEKRRTPGDSLAEYSFTPREAQVLSLALDRTSPQVAALLMISVRTVEKHLEHAFAKLGVSSRAEARSVLSAET